MYRLLTPILAVIVAVTIFGTYIKPQFNDYKRIDAEVENYNLALDKAILLQNAIDALIDQKNKIAPSDYDRLMSVIPNSVDEVAVVLSLDNIAARHRLIIQGIQTNDPSKAKTKLADDPVDQPAATKQLFQKPTAAATDGTAAGFSSRDHYSTMELAFTVTGKYDDFRAFIQDLEKNISLMDITSLRIGEVNADDSASFNIIITMYQFKTTTP